MAGVVALFAPCCISFLLPAYLGSVFKEKEKVLLMTLVFGLGIFIVMMPAVLGVALLSKALFIYHDVIYYIGGGVMLLSAAITFLGLKFPMPHFSAQEKATGKTDILSIFTLGIFSGITSACCAPVLIGILTLTFLSPNFIGALTIGGMYVFGMVLPLLIIAVFLSGRISRFAVLRKQIMDFKFLGKERIVTVSSLLASSIFFLAGILIIYLKAMGRLSMDSSEGFSKTITNAGNYANQIFGNGLLPNVILIVVLLIFFYIIRRKLEGGEKK
ncbi:MAG: hypothetical protein HYV38_02375 [Candidatus Levybacteria bacterium]|nr:hypothetical protein [Candidatus Levybacteria bacterium]